MIAYVDSSVMLRVILGQPRRLREWKDIREGLASALVEVECLRTLDRLRLRGDLNDEQLAERRETVFDFVQELTLVEPTGLILSRASQPLPVSLGTLDAIHLATALLLRETRAPDLTMTTHDSALGLAARACGFDVHGV